MSIICAMLRRSAVAALFGVCFVATGLSDVLPASADEAYVKQAMDAMSKRLGTAEQFSVDFDAALEVVTTDGQSLTLSSSGSVSMQRPDKLYAERKGGFADLMFLYDGEVLTLFGKSKNLYAQVKTSGTIDDLVDTIREDYNRPIPGGDFLVSNIAAALLDDVTDIKDLGSGVVGGVECDHFAFRTSEVDWEIWLTQEDRPTPCLYKITTKDVAGSPQYSLLFSNWQFDADAVLQSFTFENTTGADKIETSEIRSHFSDLPSNFKLGE